MLDKMLHDVEQQEKLFSLDLDLLEPAEDPGCVNTLELQPSSDALIEIPIKKSIRIPKTYETTHTIVLSDSEEPYELIRFGDEASSAPDASRVSNEYDLITFEDAGAANSLNQLQETVNKLLEDVESDEIELLLDHNQLQSDYKSFMIFSNAHTASSESLSDVSPEEDDWDDYDHGDYEPIDSSMVISNYPYELYDNSSEPRSFRKEFRDIWWEGTYRNLSVVPEEDEESVSLIGTYSGRSLDKARLDNDSNRSSYFSAKEDSNSYNSDATQSSTSSEKIVKAEVKLLVKTLDRGKEAIEIRSVREFMEDPKKEKRTKSLTLPTKLCLEKEVSMSKRGSEPCLVETKHPRIPTFTLPRLFVRKTDFEEPNSPDSKEQSPRTGLVPIPTDKYPLQCGNAGYEPLDVNLYANTPFFPCYSSPSTSSAPPNIPKGYCDWIPEFGVTERGNVIHVK